MYASLAFGFAGGMWNLILLVLDYGLSFTFQRVFTNYRSPYEIPPVRVHLRLRVIKIFSFCA